MSVIEDALRRAETDFHGADIASTAVRRQKPVKRRPIKSTASNAEPQRRRSKPAKRGHFAMATLVLALFAVWSAYLVDQNTNGTDPTLPGNARKDGVPRHLGNSQIANAADHAHPTLLTDSHAVVPTTGTAHLVTDDSTPVSPDAPASTESEPTGVSRDPKPPADAPDSRLADSSVSGQQEEPPHIHVVESATASAKCAASETQPLAPARTSPITGFQPVLSRFRVEGVVLGDSGGMAVVSGKLVRVGQTIDDARVVRISAGGVTLQVGPRTYFIPIAAGS